MVKPVAKLNPIRTQILGSLIEAKPHTWEQRVIKRGWDDHRPADVLVLVPHVHGETLRFPLAQNVSEDSVNVLAKRWAA